MTGELIPTYLTKNSTIGTTHRMLVEFEFHDGGSRIANYKYQSFDLASVPTSQDEQSLSSVTKLSPSSVDDIPDREGDAVLRTMAAAEETWALSTHTVQLLLGGNLTGEWAVTFPVPMLPFRVDGTWTMR